MGASVDEGDDHFVSSESPASYHEGHTRAITPLWQAFPPREALGVSEVPPRPASMPRAVQEDERETHRLAPATDEQGSDEEVEVEIEVEEEATVDVNVSPRPMPTEPVHPFSVYVPHLSPFLLAQNRSLKEDSELIGRHVLVRPDKDADEGARNIRLLTRPRSKQCRARGKMSATWSTVVAFYTARLLLGWTSLSTMVLPNETAVVGCWSQRWTSNLQSEPWTGHRDPETGRTSLL